MLALTSAEQVNLEQMGEQMEVGGKIVVAPLNGQYLKYFCVSFSLSVSVSMTKSTYLAYDLMRPRTTVFVNFQHWHYALVSDLDGGTFSRFGLLRTPG